MTYTCDVTGEVYPGEVLDCSTPDSRRRKVTDPQPESLPVVGQTPVDPTSDVSILSLGLRFRGEPGTVPDSDTETLLPEGSGVMCVLHITRINSVGGGGTGRGIERIQGDDRVP